MSYGGNAFPTEPESIGLTPDRRAYGCRHGYLSHKLPCVLYLLPCISLSVSLTVWLCAQISAKKKQVKTRQDGGSSVQLALIKRASLNPAKG